MTFQTMLAGMKFSITGTQNSHAYMQISEERFCQCSSLYINSQNVSTACNAPNFENKAPGGYVQNIFNIQVISSSRCVAAYSLSQIKIQPLN